MQKKKNAIAPCPPKKIQPELIFLITSFKILSTLIEKEEGYRQEGMGRRGSEFYLLLAMDTIATAIKWLRSSVTEWTEFYNSFGNMLCKPDQNF